MSRQRRGLTQARARNQSSDCELGDLPTLDPRAKVRIRSGPVRRRQFSENGGGVLRRNKVWSGGVMQNSSASLSRLCPGFARAIAADLLGCGVGIQLSCESFMLR